MATTLKLGAISVEVVRKDIKNVHLSVYPPHGRVRIAAPRHMKLDTIRVFAAAKLGWIKKQQQKLAAQAREPVREYVERESHDLWGRRYLLNVIESHAPQGVELKGSRIVLKIRPGASAEHRAELMAQWRRQVLRQEAMKLIAVWKQRLGVSVNRLLIQSMKTKWGSCNPKTRNIRLNTDLSKKPKQCLDYLILHEMAHLLVPNHGEAFVRLINQHMPHWRSVRSQLNELPLSNEPTPSDMRAKKLAA